MKVLHLTLKKKWFDMILSGEKKEEYREAKPYWVERFIQISRPEEEKGENKYIPEDILFDLYNGHRMDDVMKAYYGAYKPFDVIQFRNGYNKSAPRITVECKGISFGKPNASWSETARDCFVISLGNIISHT